MDTAPGSASDEGSVASKASSASSKRSTKAKSNAQGFANPARPCLVCPIQEPIYGLGSLLTIQPTPTSATSCKYVHDTCARCIPELQVTRTSVMGIESILKDRWAQECCVCGLGGCVAMRCGVGGCIDAVHVGCAVKMGWVVKGEAKVWCGKHAPRRSQLQPVAAHTGLGYHGHMHAVPPPPSAAAYPPPYYGWPGAPPPTPYAPRPGTAFTPPAPSHMSAGYPTMPPPPLPPSTYAANAHAHWSHQHRHPHTPPYYPPYPPPPPSYAAYAHAPPLPPPSHAPGGAPMYGHHNTVATATYSSGAVSRSHASFAYPPAAPQFPAYPPQPHHAPHAGPAMGSFAPGPGGRMSVPLSEEHADRLSASS
ncbi:hypothetical protein BCR44DRAFT_1296799 [Catenaria anguillulae PL171]|uniref:PHD-type domain-containing protein n=1 Tax=Catenaria anguillulae PL171 TaxID=765915 RepID=A0A1Y2HVP5_9FUNG|nr:hypothetical protein BCR44DRAFT_1296799 [Catenaria anguillulae PL171]